MEVHGRIWIFKIAKNCKALEFLRLKPDPASSKFTAFLAEFVDRHFVLVLAFSAIFLFDLPFDRQAVTIPARNVVRVIAAHLEGTCDHILEDLVQCVTNMNIAIGIGRTVMQHIERTVLCLFAQLLIEVHTLPAFNEKRFALWQARAHRKFGLRQIKGFGIIDFSRLSHEGIRL